MVKAEVFCLGTENVMPHPHYSCDKCTFKSINWQIFRVALNSMAVSNFDILFSSRSHVLF